MLEHIPTHSKTELEMPRIKLYCGVLHASIGPFLDVGISERKA